MSKTSKQYDSAIETCKKLYNDKMKDYGSAWRILRLPSLTDQIFIKALRIRSIQSMETQETQKIVEGEYSEFIGIVNYSIMALINIEKGVASQPDLDLEQSLPLYERYALNAKRLMKDKNHDYGEAWREIRISSLTDLILQKILRIKQIEDNQGKTIVSEGIDANYYDIINYAVFCMIKLKSESK